MRVVILFSFYLTLSWAFMPRGPSWCCSDNYLYVYQVSPHFHEKELILFSQGLWNVREERDDGKLCCPFQETLGRERGNGSSQGVEGLLVCDASSWLAELILQTGDFLYLNVSALHKGHVSGFSLHWLTENRNINSIFIILIMLLIYSIKAGFLFSH